MPAKRLNGWYCWPCAGKCCPAKASRQQNCLRTDQSIFLINKWTGCSLPYGRNIPCCDQLWRAFESDAPRREGVEAYCVEKSYNVKEVVCR